MLLSWINTLDSSLLWTHGGELKRTGLSVGNVAKLDDE